ncbi:MAG: ATP-dependent helicase RecQ [Nocardioidaceae bacterium]|jgi:ATP-dependent DNA helicase RecQ|nr:ATP-dependent helicase RecQ [Nocardioidaceae bacterium]
MTTSHEAPAAQAGPLRAQAEQVLQALVGSPQARLRADQWVAIEALVADGRRALVVQRTGWGKSAVYFVASALLRARGSGPTIIVSPLLALMRNQIAAAERAGIHAVTINSTNPEQWAALYDDIDRGDVDVLLVSPERLNNPDFRDLALPRLAATAGLVVVDEAHCISDWGHDFRPDYRRIRTLLGDLPGGIPVLATTATANLRVVTDVAEQLSVTGDGSLADVLVLRGSLDRESLHLGVLQLPSHAARLGWLAANLSRLEGSGIIYCLTVAATHDVADHLRERGHAVVAYSGQTDQAERLAAEDDLLNNRVKALVATSALGMGFDKPDLGFVIHLGAPPSPIAYYQQVGRAGRGVDEAVVILLPGREDVDVWAYFASLSFPPERDVREAISALETHGGPMSTGLLETTVSLPRGRLEAMLKVLDVDGAVRRVRGGWVATGEPWSYDADRYARVAETRRVEQQAMLDYEVTGQCRLEYLRRALDDPEAAPCGRCDNCGLLSIDAEVAAADLEQAGERIARPGVVVEARKVWPTAMPALGIDLSGRIPPEEQAEPGRAVGRLTDLGWGNQLRDLFAPGVEDGELPVPLRHGLVQVLETWDFGADGGPDAIVGVDSSTRPMLVRQLASGLSRYTGWPEVARLVVAAGAPPARADVNSAHRLAAVFGRLTIDPRPGIAGRRVLLLDDRTDSGWTLAVAARQLRLAGADAVFPLVLAASN